MADDWIMVRVRRTTHALLTETRASMELGEAAGLRNLRHGTHEEVSLDEVIVQLVEMRRKHAQRRKRSAAQRRALKAASKMKRELCDSGLMTEEELRTMLGIIADSTAPQ